MCEALDPEFRPTSYDEKCAHSLNLNIHLEDQQRTRFEYYLICVNQYKY